MRNTREAYRPLGQCRIARGGGSPAFAERETAATRTAHPGVYVIAPGSVVHTDGWDGYTRLKANGYHHRVTYLRGEHALASELLPRVHRVVSLLKRWLLGTHQGRVGHAHLDYYLDEFTFRFNRRRSKHRGKLFFRLVQQAVAMEPMPYRRLVQDGRNPRR